MASTRPQAHRHGNGARSPGAPDVIETPENTFEVLIDEMEFLGSYWRCRLKNDRFGDNELIADFSVNAARRLDLNASDTMTIELPKGRLRAFGPPEQ